MLQLVASPHDFRLVVEAAVVLGSLASGGPECVAALLASGRGNTRSKSGKFESSFPGRQTVRPKPVRRRQAP